MAKQPACCDSHAIQILLKSRIRFNRLKRILLLAFSNRQEAPKISWQILATMDTHQNRLNRLSTLLRE